MKEARKMRRTASRFARSHLFSCHTGLPGRSLSIYIFIRVHLCAFVVDQSYFSQAAKVEAMASLADTRGSSPISIGQSIARSGSFQTKARSMSGR